MVKFDTDYQAYRKDTLHRLRNMDPDELVDELAIDTDSLISALKDDIELYIEETYYGDNEDEIDGEGFNPFE